MKVGALQQMDLGDIVSAAWFLCARHWQPLFLMALLTGVASVLINVGFLPLLASAPPTSSTRVAMPHLPMAFVPLLTAGTLVFLFNQLAFIRYSLDLWVGGHAAVGPAYASALHSFLPAFGAATATSVAFILGVATWLGIPVAIYFLVCWSLTGQVCVGEGEKNPFRVLRRSRGIVRGAWWRSAGILAAITLLALLPSIAIAWVPAQGAATMIIMSAIATAVAAPFHAGAQTMLYLDLRIRKHEPISLTSGGPAQSL
jgi:hypothetical protein